MPAMSLLCLKMKQTDSLSDMAKKGFSSNLNKSEAQLESQKHGLCPLRVEPDCRAMAGHQWETQLRAASASAQPEEFPSPFTDPGFLGRFNHGLLSGSLEKQ